MSDLGSGLWLLDVGFRELGFWVLDLDFWVLGFGFRVEVSEW